MWLLNKWEDAVPQMSLLVGEGGSGSYRRAAGKSTGRLCFSRSVCSALTGDSTLVFFGGAPLWHVHPRLLSLGAPVP